jgi:protein translocase SecG subunit
MSFLIGLLTVALVLDCVVLILLVIVQLPKKDAGAGMAFGGGAADALFGAGSGNALTKITKYAIGILFGLTIALSLLNAYVRKSQGKLDLPQNWQSARPAATQPAAVPAAPTANTNASALLTAPAAAVVSNAPAANP